MKNHENKYKVINELQVNLKTIFETENIPKYE